MQIFLEVSENSFISVLFVMREIKVKLFCNTSSIYAITLRACFSRAESVILIKWFPSVSMILRFFSGLKNMERVRTMTGIIYREGEPKREK